MYELRVLSAAQKDMDDLELPVLRRLQPKISLLAQNPRPHGCVKLTAEEGYRLRIGDYRILYRIDDSLRRVFVYRVKHRKEAYR